VLHNSRAWNFVWGFPSWCRDSIRRRAVDLGLNQNANVQRRQHEHNGIDQETVASVGD